MVKILLDPGHGQGSNFNRGYKGNLRNEGDANFYVCKNYIKPELERRGYIVRMTRNKISDNPSLANRGKMAKGYDLFVSWHTNAGGGTGLEIYPDVYANPNLLTNNLASRVSKVQGIKNRGVKFWKTNKGNNYFGVLRNNLATHGFLFELCFHDNRNEILNYENKIKEIVNEFCNCIDEFYGVRLSSISNNERSEEMSNQLKLDYVISCNDVKKYEKEIDKVIKYFVLSQSNFAVTHVKNDTDYSNRNVIIIGVGGEKYNHTSYADYFLKDMNDVNQFYATKANWIKFKL